MKVRTVDVERCPRGHFMRQNPSHMEFRNNKMVAVECAVLECVPCGYKRTVQL